MSNFKTDEWDWLIQVLPWDIRDDHFIFKHLKQAIRKNTLRRSLTDKEIKVQLIADMQAAVAGGDIEKLANDTLELLKP